MKFWHQKLQSFVLALRLFGAIISAKKQAKYVDEIDARGQFHQHSTSSFCGRRSKKQTKTVKISVFFALLGSACTQAVCRMLMKLTSVVLSYSELKTT
jgi:hypothetical protein